MQLLQQIFIYFYLFLLAGSKPTNIHWPMASDNKQIGLWPELTQNVIRSSHGHFTPSLKISCKLVQPFSRNVADKETKKSPENNTPSPYRGRGKNTWCAALNLNGTTELTVIQLVRSQEIWGFWSQCLRNHVNNGMHSWLEFCSTAWQVDCQWHTYDNITTMQTPGDLQLLSSLTIVG